MLNNISATIGCVILGTMTDKFHVTTCIIMSAVGTATAVLVVWGLAPSLPVLYVFCIMYGLLAGSWIAVYPGIMNEVAERSDSTRPWQGQAVGGYGSGSDASIIYSGLTGLLSGMSFLLKQLGAL